MRCEKPTPKTQHMCVVVFYSVRKKIQVVSQSALSLEEDKSWYNFSMFVLVWIQTVCVDILTELLHSLFVSIPDLDLR